VRLLVVTGVALVILLPALFFWHAWQMKSNADAFLKRAEVQEKAEKWSQAAMLVDHYLKLRPEDKEQLIRLAELRDQAAEAPRQKLQVTLQYRLALGANPEHPKAHQMQVRLAELLLEIGRYAEAEDQANALLKASERDTEAHHIKGRAILGRITSTDKPAMADAMWHMWLAVDEDPTEIVLAARLATLIRADESAYNILRSRHSSAFDRSAEAISRERITRMVAANFQVPRAYLAQASYGVRFGEGDPKQDVKKALDLAKGPDGKIDPEILITAADLEYQVGEYALAEQHYLQAKELDEKNPSLYIGLGETYVRMDKINDAARLWREGLKKADPESLALRMRLAEVLLVLRELDDAKDLLDRLEPEILSLASVMPTAQRVQFTTSLDMLQARWHFLKGDYQAALPKFRRAVMTASSLGETTPRAINQLAMAHRQLGACYVAFNQMDQAAESFDKAAALKENDAEYQLVAAQTWEKVGNTAKARDRSEKAAAVKNAPPAALVNLARNMFRSMTYMPAAERDWSQVRKAIEAARAADEDNQQLTLLEADLAAAQGNIDQAVEIMEQAHAKDPESNLYTRGLIFAYARAGRDEDADRVLATYDDKVEGRIASVTLRANLLTLRRQFDEAIAVLRTAIESAKEPTRSALRYRLSRVLLEAGQLEEARAQLRQIAEASPQNVIVQLELGEMAMDANDLAEAQKWEESLRKLEGDNGVSWCYLRAGRLVREMQGVDVAKLDEIEKLAKRIEVARPSWSVAREIRGHLAQLRGNIDEAIGSYRQAIQEGDRRLGTFERLVKLLYSQGRYSEADQLVAQLERFLPSAPGLINMAVAIDIQQKQIEPAIKRARQAVENRPNDLMSYIWLGHTLMLGDLADEAETVFRKGVDIAPNDIRAWGAMLGYYARMENSEAARKMLDEVDGREELSQWDRAIVLAQGYETIGEFDTAGKFYLQARDLDPENPTVQLRVASFFLTRDFEIAKTSLEKARALKPDSDELRRVVAVMLAERGLNEDIRDALAEMQSDLEPEELSPDDIRVQVQLLIQRNTVADQKRALRLMEELVGRQYEERPIDRLMLARLYEADDRPESARKQLRILATSERPQPEHLASYADFLLRHGENSEAGSFIVQLENLEGQGFLYVVLRTRLMSQTGKQDEIQPLIEKYMSNKLATNLTDEEKTREMVNIASLYASLGLGEAAGGWYQRILEINPQGYRPLAYWLVREDRVLDAVQVCVKAIQGLPEGDSLSEPGLILANALIRGGAPSEASAVAEPYLAKVIEQNPADVDLLFVIATLRHMQQRPGEAIQHFRKVLELRPNHAPAMNNLAMLLAEQAEDLDEALKVVNRAIALVGSKVQLQDTKGFVLFRQGKSEEALPLFEEVAKRGGADPRYHFHLALAYQKSGKVDRARAALKAAKEGELESLVLTPLERTLLDELQSGLKP
jgi:tetratricopeptide (TPR) repeat protein